MKNGLPYFILLVTLVLYGIAGYHFLTGWHPIVMMLIGMFIGIGVNSLIYLFFNFLGTYLHKVPVKLVTAVLSGIVALVALKLFGFRWPDAFYYPVVIFAILGCIVVYWFLNKKSLLSKIFLVLTLGVYLAILFVLVSKGSDPYQMEIPAAFSENNTTQFGGRNVTNPADVGSFSVETFTYGSGTDEQRAEYADEVKYKTATVDASKLIPDWKGKKKKWREKYWGFGAENFPLNGRVFMPDGEGPFPLTLIVHGNHGMIDYSDDGYGYLGNLLASRGIIAVSVDENFINGHWSGDFMGKEMPVRAWILLKHLALWRNWNGSPEHELSGKVDMEHIMLIGHSRGGEAVSIAAAYNKLPYFPDNALEKFDFNFNIKGVVALAPTDYRYDRQMILENLNFLSIQGSYDADEVSFWGMRPYHRLRFTDSIPRFKSSVYIHHANHGQFNSTWGNSDFGAPTKWLLNLEPLLEEKQQQEAAKVFVSAFAEATLKNRNEFLPIFKNVAWGKDWLPEEYYLTNYEPSFTKNIADFEEDIDVTSASDGARITTENMAVWKEEILKTRDEKSQENSALILGWDYKEDIDKNDAAVYTISFVANKKTFVQANASLQLSIGAGDHKLLPTDVQGEKDADEAPDREIPKLDFTVQLTDSVGEKTSLIVSTIKQIPKPLKTRFTKLKFLDKEMIGAEWEVQLQTFHFPLESFARENPTFDFEKLAALSLIFDKCPYGVVVVDNIAIGFQ